MAYAPPPLITSESPRLRRSRRRRQQQTNCCGCVVALMALLIIGLVWRAHLAAGGGRGAGKNATLASADFPLELTCDSPTYLRYQLVRLQARITGPDGAPVLATAGPEVVVLKDGQAVTTVGNVTRVRLRYDRNSQTYQGCWPLPWNAPPGQYHAEAWLKMADPEAWRWETPAQEREREREARSRHQKPRPVKITGESYCVARAHFLVQARPRAEMPKGLGVATWEPDFPTGDLPRPTGGRGNWQAILDWCQYMGADTLWMRGAVTEVYQGRLDDETPFNPYNIRNLPQVAAEAHRRGLRFGTWAAAYATYPPTASSNARKPHYMFAKDISRGTGAIRDLDFVSLLEPKRVDHIARFFAQMQADPNVDYVGLDYMRSDRGGYEMVDQFAREMPVKLPDGFFDWSQRRRWSYVADKVERQWQSDPNFYDSWNWWRAHTGAGVVQAIREKAQLTKPLWIFVLSWWHGKQHGQDPIMFTDAGVSLLAPMLYQVPNRGHFDRMVKDWGDYLQAGEVNLAPGDQVDFYWHQKTLRPAGPEELYDRIMTAHRGYIGEEPTLGTFLHDISRAATGTATGVYGNKGPYPGTEWALAGGAAFTSIRNNWQVHPFSAALEVPSGAPLGGSFEVKLNLQNLVKKDVRRITVRLAQTEGVAAVTALPLSISNLSVGQSVSQAITLKLKGPDGSRANRFMVAFVITWPDDDYGKTVRRDLPLQQIVMKYVQGR